MAETTTVKKTECKITRKEFAEHAQPMKAKIGDETILLQPKTYSSGSLGFFGNEKKLIEINGKPHVVTAQVVITIVGSKKLPLDETEAE